MKILNEFKEQLECSFSEEEYVIKSDSIEFGISHTNLRLNLFDKHFKILKNEKLIKNIPNLKFHNHYGFSYKTYGEYFLAINTDYLYEIYGNATDIDLKFKIGNIYLEFNYISSICVLLMNPYYSRIAHYLERGLGEYFYTLKITNAPVNEHKDIIIKALYYLNTHYLRKINLPLSVFHLIPEGYEEFNESEQKETNPDKIDKNYQRKRIFKRKDFINIEPLILFNHASTLSDENKFMGFYRVIEFFFNRALERDLEHLRYDKSISEKEIIKKVQNKDEKSLLINLLNRVLTKSDKSKLLVFLEHKGILTSNKFTNFCNTLYEYRNSLVHSKEIHISKINLPDLFNEKQQYNYWNFVIKYIAEACIKRLNLKKHCE